MDRRRFLTLGAAASAVLASCKPREQSASAATAAGAAETQTKVYLDRIAALNTKGPELRAVLEINPDAVSIAAALDRERAATGPRGPLHGVAVLIKDNIETADRMMTTAGSLALEGWYAPNDAPLVARLRRAGAVILGKSNLSEWANIRSTRSSSGWSARGGQTRNALDQTRSPSGSSSGSAVAVAANLCAMAVGTETDGSIVSPASANGIVGIKPTVGLISRSGIIPIAHSQDTAGPMARNVADAALLLGVMCGVTDNDDDAANQAAHGHIATDYTQYLHADGLRGARVGIARQFFDNHRALSELLDAQIAIMRSAGAEIVDPVKLAWSDAADNAELEVLLYELKADLNKYLVRLPAGFRVHNLADVIRFNETERVREMPYFAQELFEQAQAKGPLTDKAYRAARALSLKVARDGIDGLLRQHRLDAIVSITGGPPWLIDHVNGDSFTGSCSSPAAVAGYPHITVPAARHMNLPIGLSFFGSAYSEPRLIRLASGFESVRKPLA